MATKNNRLIPFRATHPGEILREELKERGISQKDFARAIGMQASHLNAIIKGKRNLNEDLAIKLEEQLNIPYILWMNLQAGYIYESKTSESLDTDVFTLKHLQQTISSIAERLLSKGMNVEDISDVTGLSTEEIKAL